MADSPLVGRREVSGRGSLHLEFFGENVHALGTSLNAHRNAEVQDLHDLFRRRPGPQRPLDVPTRAGRVHMSD